MNYEKYEVRVYETGEVNWLDEEGRAHRLDGPAVVRADGSEFYYHHGKANRLDGPAVVWSDGGKEWWIDNRKYTEAEFHKKVAELNNTCDGKVVEIEGKKYKLVAL